MLLSAAMLPITGTLVAQDVFDSGEFRTALKKIDSDRTNGFAQNKGTLLRTLGTYYRIHHASLGLPGMDSGRVSAPISEGRLFTTYYFKPSRDITSAMSRAASLSSAVRVNVNGNPELRKKTDSIGQYRYYKHMLFTGNAADPAYEVIYVLSKGSYQLLLRVYAGQAPVSPAPQPGKPGEEPELEQKIRALLSSMDQHFETEKGAKTANSNTYYTEYETKTTLWGLGGKLKVRKFETSIYFSADYRVLKNGEEAQQLYEKLKTMFAATGRFQFNAENIEANRKSVMGIQNGRTTTRSAWSIVIDCYTSPGFPSAGFLLIRKKDMN